MFSGQFDVKGKNVLITGGSQGLGAELAGQLFQKGASVCVLARTESNLIKTVEKVEALRVNELQKVEYKAVDLSNYEATEKALNDFKADIVFCCAGASIPKLFTDLSPSELRQGIDINLRTSINVSHIMMKKMIQDKKSSERHFVYCSSILAVIPLIGYAQYAPAKAGLRALADVIRQEGGPFGIKVHTVFAGNFQSEGFDKEEETKPSITKSIEGVSEPIPVELCATRILWWLDRGYETIFTDAVGWFLYSGMLGFSPRCFGLLQSIFALLISIIAPVYVFMVKRDIRRYYDKKK